MMTDPDLGPRLGDNPTDTLAHVLSLNPKGTAVEFGVATGRTLRLIAEHMPAIGFDSFRGLPSDWREGFEAGRFACTPPLVENSTLVVGLFADTLPLVKFPRTVGLWHLDADLYESTATILDHIGRHLKPGAYVVMDEYHGYPDWHGAGEHRAWTEFVEHAGVTYDVVGHGPEQLAVRIT